MPNKTIISESQIVQAVLQALIFIIPFTSIVLSPAQMQAAAGLSGMIAMFAWNQRRRQKVYDKNDSDNRMPNKDLMKRVATELLKGKK